MMTDAEKKALLAEVTTVNLILDGQDVGMMTGSLSWMMGVAKGVRTIYAAATK